MNRKLMLAGAAVLLLDGCTYIEEQNWWPIDLVEPEAAPAPQPASEGAVQTAVVLDEFFVGGFALEGQDAAAVVPDGPRQDGVDLLAQRKDDYERVAADMKNADEPAVASAFSQWKSGRVGSEPINRSDIEQVQNMLASLKYYDGPIDGLYGPQTAQAIRTFQSDRGLPVDGQVTGALMQALAVDL